MTKGAYYTPGVCNLNDAEVAFRTQAGYLFALGGVMLLAALFAFRVSFPYTLVLFIPTWFAAQQYIQVRNRFCMTRGLRGQYSENAIRGAFARTNDQMHRMLDTKRALMQHVQAFVLAIVVTVIAVLALNLT